MGNLPSASNVHIYLLVLTSDRELMGQSFLLGYGLICVFHVVINSFLFVTYCVVFSLNKWALLFSVFAI